MTERDKLSKTMRIDLIPDTPTEAVAGKKRVVIAAPAAKSHPSPVGVQKADEEARYQALLQSIYDAALISDLTGQIVDANSRATEFLLYDRTQICGMTVFDVISGADESLIGTLLDNLEKERFTLIQAYCIRKDGSYFPCEIAVNKVRLGGMFLCFFIRDITVRRQAEEMLRTEHNAIQNAGHGIAVADSEARLEYVNPAVAKAWGYGKPEELLGTDVRELLGRTPETDAFLKMVLSDQQTWTGEIKTFRKNKEPIDVQVSAACNRNSDGEPVGIVLSLVDISDRKRAEEALRETERQRVMLESLGAACHHLGQPATVLLANLGIIQKKLGPPDSGVKELIQTSIEAARSLGAILHRLNAVNTYKTTEYLKAPEGSSLEENRIIEI